MQKLELKHLASYLPHGVKTYHKDSNKKIQDLTPFECSKGMIELKNEQGTKLILRPLSDLLQDDDTILEIYNNSWIAGQYDIVKTNDVIAIISHEDGSNLNIFLSKPHCNMEWINEILYSKHYDLKSLIEKGLAIDINTL